MSSSTGATQMQQAATSRDSAPIRILSLDGGGMRGLITLDILKDLLMRKISSERQDSQAIGSIYPHEHFDLIAGTSTGGLLALLFGRLEYDIDRARSEYCRLGENIFGPSAVIDRFGRSAKGFKFDSHPFEKALKAVCTGSALIKNQVGSCKVFVTVVPPGLPVGTKPGLIRSYEPPGTEQTPRLDNNKEWQVWQAARATSAAPTFAKQFKPFVDGQWQYSDAGAAGFNNPALLAADEAKLVWPGRRQLLISIGTGISSISTRAGKSRPASGLGGRLQNLLMAPFKGISYQLELLEGLKRLATQTEATHESVNRLYKTERVKPPDERLLEYARFNPEDGGAISLDAWWQEQLFDSVARSYLGKDETGERLAACALLLSQRMGSAALESARLASTVASSASTAGTGAETHSASVPIQIGGNRLHPQTTAARATSADVVLPAQGKRTSPGAPIPPASAPGFGPSASLPPGDQPLTWATPFKPAFRDHEQQLVVALMSTTPNLLNRLSQRGILSATDYASRLDSTDYEQTRWLIGFIKTRSLLDPGIVSIWGEVLRAEPGLRYLLDVH